MGKNANLSNAKNAKNDEFYTQLADIENELRHYKADFYGKTVLCNCDDPFESNFFKYFAMNFNHLRLNKLICTSYDDSPVAYTQLSLLDDIPDRVIPNSVRKAYKIEITEVDDYNKDGAVDLADVEFLLKNDKNTLKLLNGDGDFRSSECIELLKQADIVVTNPPFSLFREYVAQLIEYDKKFIIIGNMNAITYKEIFPLIKDGKLWTGFSFNKTVEFIMSDSYELKGKAYIDKQGRKHGFVPAINWYTNVDIIKRHEDLPLYKSFSPQEYPKYDNYDAIEVSKVADIPYDYDGFMGVPITFLDKYNPEQFEIIGLLQSSDEKLAGVPILRIYNNFKEMRQDMTFTGCSGVKANGNPVLPGKSQRGNFLYNPDTNEYVHSAYARILIRRRK